MFNPLKKFARMALVKNKSRIRVEFIEATSEGTFDKPFLIEWRRGPLKDYTIQYNFNSGKTIKLNHAMEKISTFYQTKDGKIQDKSCEFRLVTSEKQSIQSLKMNMSYFYFKKDKIKIKFDKVNVTIILRFDIEPYDEKKHANILYQSEMEHDEEEDGDGVDVLLDQSNA